MAAPPHSVRARRVYPLDPREVSQEELAVVFAMTSRRPEPFDEIQTMVTAEKAEAFHERWVLGYGHASVAEHAVVHLAVENISRLACDTLEDNRLASFTEKSSRYQIIDRDAYFTPPELDADAGARDAYAAGCSRLFALYEQLVEESMERLQAEAPDEPGETDGQRRLRLRRIATDACRFVLPASTLTNVGVTMNTRTLEHAVRKLLSSDLQEEREIGEEIKAQAKAVTPTLVRYADRNAYIERSREALREQASALLPKTPLAASGAGGVQARLVETPPDAEARLAAALLYRNATETYDAVRRRADALSPAEREGLIDAALTGLGPHDAAVRELEQVECTFEYVLDYGAYREFKRHRMQSYLSQPLTAAEGYAVPPLLQEGALASAFDEAMEVSAGLHRRLAALSPRVAEYAVTHAHLRRVLTRMNLRECYHFFKLRAQPQAHFTIRDAAQQAMNQLSAAHPLLMRYISLRGE